MIKKKPTPTKRQQETLDAISDFIKAHQYPPTNTELAKILKVKSTNMVRIFLKELEAKGYIHRTPATARAIRILKLA